MRALAAIVVMCAGAAAQADDAAPARQNYLLHCMGCHGEDGAGLEGQVPSLRGTLARISSAPAGRDYVLRVPGVTQSTLAAAEVAAVLNWILVEYSGAEAASSVRPFTAAEVASARNQTLLEIAPARARILRDAE
jgi:mono/diheme cytochrome c family protein